MAGGTALCSAIPLGYHVALPEGSAFAGRASPSIPSGVLCLLSSARRLVSGYFWRLYSGASLRPESS